MAQASAAARPAGGGFDATMFRTILDGLQSGKVPELVEAFTAGASTPTALQAVVEQANLRPEQAAVFKLLMSLQGREDVIDAEATTVEAVEPDAAGADRVRLSTAATELADLREVNDTVAAALGACRVCWGGDGACGECGGRGAPGSRRPDPVLFERLVVPAVRRLRTPKRAEPAWPRRSR